MLLSLNWLKDFVKLPKDVEAADLATKLTMHTVEVESFVNQKESFTGVVVGKVLEVEKHPNADRLRVTKVDIKSEILSIVCGAPNVEAGQMVAVATIGTVLPNDLEIKASEIRGEKSFGMLCAEDELGLGSDHEGIMVLSKEAKPGQSFAAYLKLNDIILEIDNKSLSNRSDLWGHYGIAREISAFYDAPLVDYKDFTQNNLEYGTAKLEVKNEEKKLCSRYMAIKISGINIDNSPAWLRDRLLSAGMRPINNIVDITNYVMLELGQPLHAFAADKVDKIVIRQAKKNEYIETLDSKERELDEEMLVISSSSEAIAIAGVIGGQHSAISNETKEIILEAANFNAVSIRKTSDKLALRTESSMRFEKALDPNFAELGLQRAFILIKKVCPEAKIETELVDIKNYDLDCGPLSLSLAWINEKSGHQFEKEKVINILERLGFVVELNGEEMLVTIPTWRAAKDVAIKEDVLEEILRVYGYDNIISTSLVSELKAPGENINHLLEQKIKNIFVGNLSLSENYNYSFVGENQLTKLNIDVSNHIKLVNPISDQQTILRSSLLIGLLNNIKVNQFNFNEIRMFEFGRVFSNTPGNEDKQGDDRERLPYQENRVAFVLSGKLGNYFSEAKGLVSELLTRIFNKAWEVEFAVVDNFPEYSDAKKSVRVRVNGRDLGIISTLNKESLFSLGIKNETVFAELNMVEIKALYSVCPSLKYQATPKYPSVSRDLAFVVDNGMMYNDLRREILSFDGLINSVVLFDSYQGSKLGDDKKSLAFHVIYSSNERTLTANEVDKIQQELISSLEQKFGAQIRNF